MQNATVFSMVFLASSRNEVQFNIQRIALQKPLKKHWQVLFTKTWSDVITGKQTNSEKPYNIKSVFFD